jgi:hypothetical protein
MFSFFYPIYLLRSVIDFKDQTKLLIEWWGIIPPPL